MHEQNMGMENWIDKKNPEGQFTTHSDLAHFMLLKYKRDFTSKYFTIFISGGVRVVYIKNQRPKGHIAHLRNHFNQEIHLSKDMIIPQCWMREKNHFLFKNRMLPLFVKTSVPYTPGCSVLYLVEIGPVVMEKKNFYFFKFRQCIFAISFSPLGKGCGPSFEQQPWILYTQRCFLPSFVEIGIVVLERKLFKFFWTFLLDHYSLPLENFLLYPSILCIKFGWNWPSDSRKRRWKCKQTDNRRSENLTWTFNSGESNRNPFLMEQSIMMKNSTHNPCRGQYTEIMIER